MSDPFFDHPILNSPYEYPSRHWELDEYGQPTQKIIERRRSASSSRRSRSRRSERQPTAQTGFVFDEGKGLSTKEQQYDPTSIINEVRGHVDAWRELAESQPVAGHARDRSTAPALAASRFSDVRPFFCQVEAVETAIWLTEVAPQSRKRQADSSTTSQRRTKTPTPN